MNLNINMTYGECSKLINKEDIIIGLTLTNIHKINIKKKSNRWKKTII